MSGPKKQDGYVLVTVAAVLVMLLAFAALAVDMGVLYSARAAAQRGVDAAALAGAFTFVVNPTASQPATAVQHAKQTALNNTILTNPIKDPELTVTVDVANRRVTVDLNHDEGTYFARILNWNIANITVRGIAEASATAVGANCTKPWFVPNTIISPLDPCDACAANEVLVDSKGQVTKYAESKLGLQFTIKPGNPENALAPGSFYAIQLSNDPNQSGGDVYRENIATCSDDATIFCMNTYSVKTGNMIGPTKQGVTDLITIKGTVEPDKWLNVAQYKHPDSTVSDTSHQLIVAPIWDLCGMAGFCSGGKKPTGTNVKIPVLGFALLFLDGVQGNDVIAHLVGVSACNVVGGGGGPAPGEVGPFAVPVRLIRVS